jgi:hypothetical protein
MAGGDLRRNPLGDRHRAVGAHHIGLGIAAEAAGIGGPSPALKRVTPSPTGVHHARGLAARDRRQFHGIEAGAVVGVDEVDPDRLVADADLAGGRRRRVDLHPLQDLGAAGLGELDRAHQESVLSKKARVRWPALAASAAS